LETVCIEGNGSRESHLGNGYSVSDTMYTLNTVEQHAVSYSVAEQQQISDWVDAVNSFVTKDDTIGSLCASDYKGIRNQDIDDGKWIIQKSK
jgi:DNA (cytosine-5)-methyltransferase 1